MKAMIKTVVARVLRDKPSAREKVKHWNELLFWKIHYRKTKGNPHNSHFQFCFTELFGLTKEYYTSKRVIDIGCGPLGTLEWADNAAERVGADPLATSYQALTKGKHAMRYVTCNSESIPFEDGHFDIVSMFNSLDHVFDVDATIAELKRICRPGGDIMIIVELDQKPTITEPHSIGLSVLEAFPGFEVMHRSVYELGEGHNIYKGLLGRVARTSDAVPGVLCARLRKRVAQQPLEKSRRAS